MRRKAPRRKAPPAPEAPEPEESDSGTVGEDGGGQRTEVGLPYNGEGGVQRPPERQTPPRGTSWTLAAPVRGARWS